MYSVRQDNLFSHRRIAASDVAQRGARIGVDRRFEEEEDPLLAEEPDDEVVVALAILHAVVTRRVLALGRPAMRNAALGEEGSDDLGHGFILEDAAVAPAPQQPQGRHEAQPKVPMVMSQGTALPECRSDAAHDA